MTIAKMKNALVKEGFDRPKLSKCTEEEITKLYEDKFGEIEEEKIEQPKNVSNKVFDCVCTETCFCFGAYIPKGTIKELDAATLEANKKVFKKL